MPYILPKTRAALDANPGWNPIHPASAGELNYKITQLLLAYLGKNPNYERLNAVVGVLECAKLELTRRVVVPYEEKKKAENGDVYPPTKENDDGLS